MMNTRKIGFRFFSLCFVTASIILITGCPKESTPPGKSEQKPLPAKKPDRAAEKVYNVVAMINLTGRMSALGQAKKEAIETATEMINAHGGIKGRKLHIEFADTHSNPREAVTVYKKYAKPGETVILGPPTPMALAIDPLLDKDRVIMFATSGHPSVSKPEYAFRCFTNATTEGRLLREHCLAKGYKRIFVLHTEEPYGSALASELGANSKLKVYAEGYKVGTVDFRNLLAKLSDLKPDAVLLCGFGLTYKQLLKQLAEVGWQKPVVGNIGAAWLPLAFVPKEVRSKWCFIGPSWLAKPKESASPFFRKFKEMHKGEPVYYGVFLADALWLLAHVAKEVPSIDTKDLRARLVGLKDADGLSGKVSISPDGDFTYELDFFRFDGEKRVLSK